MTVGAATIEWGSLNSMRIMVTGWQEPNGFIYASETLPIKILNQTSSKMVNLE